MAKFFMILFFIFCGLDVAFIISACIAAGRADDREERWFYERSDKQKSGD